ncbi:MAG: UDP-N-acetylmuramoyl-L-alanyl-D-glutamate--2,6-diaminopimelate ligase [Armatimonadetes bacterium]|nr:MAG: UDP-N-acetylmuramoyl-L-alanyl-D-glutamate--2,6-diaminopimelate ligase [Armatimonadota bacterium]
MTEMRHLASLAAGVPGLVSVDAVTVHVEDVTHDSRNAGPGVIFAAVEGLTMDGHQFVPQAALAGSPAALVNRRIDTEIPQIVVSDSRTAMAYLAAEVHGRPADGLNMIGVTGTNGKTTIGAMCEAALAVAGRQVGIIGTLGARVGGEPMPLQRTTPESTDLQRLLAVMSRRGVDTVIMEVSSHAMELGRVDAISFDVVAFTNLSQDHLDFHGDMDAYFAAKRRLFDPERSTHAIINVSDDAGRRLANDISIPITTVGVGTGSADAPGGSDESNVDTSTPDIVAEILHQSDTGSEFDIVERDVRTHVTLPLAGSFNVANAAVAFAICRQLSIAPSVIADGLGSLAPIPGRMQLVSPGADISVIVDYAHTPDAVETVVKAGRSMTDGRLIAVLGAGGDRDHEKRARMGSGAATHADVTIVTTDNPRSEDPATIASAVAKGARAVSGAAVEVVLDRTEAIRHAISAAEPGDVVLILGRGHEQGQEVMGRVIPLSDADVATSVLHDLGHTT